MGNALYFRPPPPSYSLQTLTSPPLYYIYGVPCLWYPQSKAPGIIIYLHANATDLGQIQAILFELSRTTGYTVLGVEYPGYGIFSGTPSPEGCVRAALKIISYIQRHGQDVPIIIMGRSIGTGVAGQLCAHLYQQNRPPQALILISPFTSIAEVAATIVGNVPAALFCGSVFPTDAVLPTVTCPTLLLHGVVDKFIPIQHSQRLLTVSGAFIKKLVPLKDTDHNDLPWALINDEIKQFLLALRK